MYSSKVQLSCKYDQKGGESPATQQPILHRMWSKSTHAHVCLIICQQKKKKKVEGRLFLNWRWNQFKRNQDLVTKSQEFSVHCLFSANSSQGEPTPSESGQLKKKKICNWICCTFTMMEWVFIYTSTGERKISLIVLVALELVRAHLNSPKETKDHGNN